MESDKNNGDNNEVVAEPNVSGENDICNSTENVQQPSNESVLVSGQPNYEKLAKLYEKYCMQSNEIDRLEKQNSEYREQLIARIREKDAIEHQSQDFRDKAANEFQMLTRKSADLESQLKALRDRGVAQEAHYRKTLQETNQKFALEIEQLKKTSANAKSEMDLAVIKYAQREAQLIQMKEQQAIYESQIEHLRQDLDDIRSRPHDSVRHDDGSTNEAAELNTCDNETLTSLRKEIEQLKSSLEATDNKLIVANKRADESDLKFKATQSELSIYSRRAQVAREETATIKGDYHRLIEQIQMREQERKTEVQEQSDQQEIHETLTRELDTLKQHHKETLRKVTQLEIDLSEKSIECEELERSVNQLTSEKDEMQKELERMTPMCNLVQSADAKAAECSLARECAERNEQDARAESKSCRLAAESALALNQQLTQNNIQLSTENVEFKTRLANIEERYNAVNDELQKVRLTFTSLENDYSQLKVGSSAEILSLQSELSAKNETAQTLQTALDDERNRNQILQKKHAASIKELRSELSTLKKAVPANTEYATHQLNIPNSNRAPSSSAVSSYSNGQQHASPQKQHSSSSGHSRASSVTSLEKITATVVPEAPTTAETQNRTSDSGSADVNERMIEKICKLQRQLARRTEKIEFLDEHVKQLSVELQKKSRLVQMFAVREDAGALTTPSMDHNKLAEVCDQAQIGRYAGSTMASLYSSDHAQVPMTLDTSLEINRKLQAVFEDALLKNITLKQSLETMGNEIAKLSRENRELKLEKFN